MSTKPKCSTCNERDVFSGGLCSSCYGKAWRKHRKEQREGASQLIATEPDVKQLTSGAIAEDVVVVPAIVPSEHLVALNPVEMAEARGDLRAWLERKLTGLEHDIVEANAALEEARRNGWAASALTSARNRAVDDETFYNKILVAVEAGHTIIPDFPIDVFAVRRHENEKSESVTYQGVVHPSATGMGRPIPSDCAPAGAGEYRNPEPHTYSSVRENRAPGAQGRNEPRHYTTVTKSPYPVGPVKFPAVTARSPIMKATAAAMEEKVFDQFGVCFPIGVVGAQRQVQTQSARAGDPLVIGQILRKKVGSQQKCVSFIIAWYLNLNDL